MTSFVANALRWSNNTIVHRLPSNKKNSRNTSHLYLTRLKQRSCTSYFFSCSVIHLIFRFFSLSSFKSSFTRPSESASSRCPLLFCHTRMRSCKWCYRTYIVTNYPKNIDTLYIFDNHSVLPYSWI